MTMRTVQSDADLDRLFASLRVRKRPFTVNITQGVQRSNEQNRLQWLWYNEIAQQLGDRTPQEVRAECKLTLGVPILRESNEAFREKYDRIIRPLSFPDKLALMVEPIDLPVTSLFTTEQNTRYLDAIFQKYTTQGCRLTLPVAA